MAFAMLMTLVADVFSAEERSEHPTHYLRFPIADKMFNQQRHSNVPSNRNGIRG